jgi:hypothetical protein
MGFVLVSLLFLWSAWAQSMWFRVDRQGRWSGHASARLVGVGSLNVVDGRYAKALVWSRLCSFGRRGLRHCVCGKISTGVGLVSPLFFWSSWAQSLRWRADRQWACSRLASFPLVGVGTVTLVEGRSARALV